MLLEREKHIFLYDFRSINESVNTDGSVRRGNKGKQRHNILGRKQFLEI
jgi:hypothetical protein